MSLIRWILTSVLIIVMLIVISVSMLISGYSSGWMVKKKSVEALAEDLVPHLLTARPPKGEGPYPVALIIPGCGGVIPDFHLDWAGYLANEGYYAIVVDSFAPRGVTREEALVKVCSGQILWGRERAGDIMAMLSYIRTQPDLDASNVLLFGQSHGAWAIMDLLSMDFQNRAPTNLHPRPDPALRETVRASVLLYPYCGAFTLSRDEGWNKQVPSLMVVAEQDSVVSPRACQKTAEVLAGAGVPMAVKLYPDADHAFDQYPTPGASDWQGYDEAFAKELRQDVKDFLDRLAR